MAFEPDIIITTPGGRIMVIEAKVAMTDLPHTEEALKRYMVGMQYPFGLLITPEKGWVYRDSYSSFSPPPFGKSRSSTALQYGARIHLASPSNLKLSCSDGSKNSAISLRNRCRPSSKTSFKVMSCPQSPTVK